MADREKGKKHERREREAPSILTAAGLLAFYEEEEARFKITPGVVIAVAVLFIAAIIGLELLF